MTEEEAPQLPEKLATRVQAARGELEAMLLRIDDHEQRDREARTNLREAVAKTSTMADRRAGDDALLDDLDALLLDVGRIASSLREELRGREQPVLDELRAHLTDLRERVLEHLASPRPTALAAAPLDFAASVGSPSLHFAPVLPAPQLVEVPLPWDAPPKLDDDEEAAPRLPDARTPEQIELARIGRDALEDIAILGSLRRLRDVERWGDAAAFEQRLLDNLDALYVLDHPTDPASPRLGVPEATFRYGTEWPVVDWGRAFAIAFVLGSTNPAAALRWVVLAFRRSPAKVAPAFVDGLSLAANPAVGDAVLDLVSEETEPFRLAALLEILARRQTFAPSAVVPLLEHPDGLVKAHAVRCLRHAEAELAASLLGDLLDEPGCPVELAVLTELVRLAHPRAAPRLREILTDAVAGHASREQGLSALRLLALAGDPSDADRLLGAAQHFGHEALWTLGFAGVLDHAAVLREHIEQAGGAAPAEQAPASAELAELTSSYARIVGRGVGADRESFERACQDLPSGTLRFGKARDRVAIAEELLAPHTRQGVRRTLAFELAISADEGSARVDLEVEDWSDRQRRLLLATIEQARSRRTKKS